jgi:hypothetical protein
MSMTIARPTVTKEMILAACLIVATKIDADAETIAEHYRHPMDGHELAKALDMYAGWDTRREDMEALDEIESLVSSALSAAEKQWFTDSDIQPTFPIGAKILGHHGNGSGEITGIYEYGVAMYQVKPDGQDDEATGRRRWLIKFEDAVAA